MDYLFGRPQRPIDSNLGAARSAPLTGKEISQAGSALRALRTAHRPRKLSGWINGVRVRKGTAAILPDGRLAEILGAQRGRVVLRVTDPRLLTGMELLVAAEAEVTVVKTACAVALGSLKAGCVEKTSQKKLEACRRNARCPARPGRKRGRPKGRKPIPPVNMTATPPTRPLLNDFARLVSYYSARASQQSR